MKKSAIFVHNYSDSETYELYAQYLNGPGFLAG